MPQSYLPHFSCLLGDPWLISAQILGNLLVFYAYVVIPLTYVRAIRRHKAVRLHADMKAVYVWTAVFVFCCALTHAIAIVTLFWGGLWYWAQALLMILTGGVSLYTAIRVIPLIPKTLSQREVVVKEITTELSLIPEMEANKAKLADIFEKLDSIGGH